MFAASARHTSSHFGGRHIDPGNEASTNLLLRQGHSLSNPLAVLLVKARSSQAAADLLVETHQRFIPSTIV
jgi:hypothetical protein